MKIAISGLGSAGTTSTAKAVSERLGIALNTYTLRTLADDMQVDFEYMHAKAKKNDPSIDRLMDTQQIEFLHNNESGVVASDLACWLDDSRIYKTLGLHQPTIDLKIWLNPSYEARAARFASRHDGTSAGLAQYDQELIEHYKALYTIDITDPTGIDWVFETSTLDLQAVVDTITERATRLDSTSGPKD